MGCNCGSKDDWKAILNMQPPGPARLYVTGTADCTTTGYHDVRLEKVVPQGTNPRELLLELKWKAPSGSEGHIITPHEVRFELERSPEYKEVIIVNCDHKKIKVEVVV